MANEQTPNLPAASDNAPAESEVQGLSAESLSLLGADTNAEPESQAPAETGELGEEFKPYSQFPWASMDQETRQETLDKLKKFHGDMSRGSQEAAELRRQMGELQDKASWLDNLATQPWFQQAYQSHMSGQQPAAQQEEAPTFQKLNEYGVDSEAAQLMEKAVEAKLQDRLGGLAQKLEFLERSVVQDQTNNTLKQLAQYAKDRGYPSPEDKMVHIRRIIQDGRATTVEDAYRLSIMDDVPQLVATKTREQLTNELKQKQDALIPPGRSAAGSPQEDYSGPDGVQKAIADARRELGSLQGR
jgi:hypothetical protein